MLYAVRNPKKGDSVADDKIEALRCISNIHRAQFDLRQKVEWRVLITALTIYVGAAIGVDRLSHPHVISLFFVYAGYVIFTVTVLAWLLQVHMNHAINKHVAEAAEDKLLLEADFTPKSFFGDKNQKPCITERAKAFFGSDSVSNLGARRTFYFGCQVWIVVLFSVLSCSFVTAVINNSESNSDRLTVIEAREAELEKKVESLIKNGK